MTKNEIEREQYESRWRALLDERSRLHDATAEGMERGIEKGRGQGVLVGQIRAYQHVLGLPTTAEEQLFLLPLEELKALAERLEQQVAAGRS